MQTSQKNSASNKITNEWKKRREERKGGPLSIFLNTFIQTLLSQCPKKPFLMSKCQISNLQKVRCRRVSYTSHVCKTLRAPSWMTDVSVEVNCHNWPIKGRTRSWYTGGGIENNAYRLQYSVSPRPPHGFHATVSRSAFPWNRQFERLYFIAKCL